MILLRKFFVCVIVFTGALKAHALFEIIQDEEHKLPVHYNENNKTFSFYRQNCTLESIKDKAFGCDEPVRTSQAESDCEQFPERLKSLCRQIDFTSSPSPVESQETETKSDPSPPPLVSEAEEESDIPPLPPLNEGDTEAGGACNTPACLQAQENPAQQTATVITQMCMDALPEHCQQVQPKFTSCTPTDEMSWGQIAGYSAGSCLTGLWDGLVDTLWFFGSMAKGLGVAAWKAIRKSEYYEEAMDTGSFLVEDLQGFGPQGLKSMFEKAFWEEVDEFMICLNTRGRYEYACEGVSQVVVGGAAGYGAVKGAGVMAKGIRNPSRALRWRLRGMRGKFPNLTRKQRRQQTEKLQDMLNTRDELDVGELTPFMLSRLSKKQFQTRVDFSKLTDAQAMQLSKHRLKQIHPTEYAKMDIENLVRTLDRMPDEGFKALMRGRNASHIPIASVEKNLHRIPPVSIEDLKNIHKVDPKVFRKKMSSERLRGLTFNQADNIKKGPQYQSLARRQREIIDDILSKPRTPASPSSSGGAGSSGTGGSGGTGSSGGTSGSETWPMAIKARSGRAAAESRTRAASGANNASDEAAAKKFWQEADEEAWIRRANSNNASDRAAAKKFWQEADEEAWIRRAKKTGAEAIEAAKELAKSDRRAARRAKEAAEEAAEEARKAAEEARKAAARRASEEAAKGWGRPGHNTIRVATEAEREAAEKLVKQQADEAAKAANKQVKKARKKAAEQLEKQKRKFKKQKREEDERRRTREYLEGQKQRTNEVLREEIDILRRELDGYRPPYHEI